MIMELKDRDGKEKENKNKNAINLEEELGLLETSINCLSYQLLVLNVWSFQFDAFVQPVVKWFELVVGQVSINSS